MYGHRCTPLDVAKSTSAAVLGGSYPAILVLDRELTVFERVASPDHSLLEAAVEEALKQ